MLGTFQWFAHLGFIWEEFFGGGPPPVPAFELREDGGFELREDGSHELRE